MSSKKKNPTPKNLKFTQPTSKMTGPIPKEAK